MIIFFCLRKLTVNAVLHFIPDLLCWIINIIRINLSNCIWPFTGSFKEKVLDLNAKQTLICGGYLLFFNQTKGGSYRSIFHQQEIQFHGSRRMHENLHDCSVPIRWKLWRLNCVKLWIYDIHSVALKTVKIPKCMCCTLKRKQAMEKWHWEFSVRKIPNDYYLAMYM